MSNKTKALPVAILRAQEKVESVLTTWEATGLISQGWGVEWSDVEGALLVSFLISGDTGLRVMTEASFDLYVRGWKDRSVAVMHRRTPPATTGARRQRSVV